MNEQREQQPLSSNALNHLFTRLNPLDVEQFYTAYQLWITQQRMYSLHMQIDHLSHALAENTKRLEQTHPPALALAALARLQSNGVSDADILDRMLERGEEWLDRTMQHLDYCERIDVISGDYTKWCEHALEGAYDWIDSMQEVNASSSIETDASTAITPVNNTDTAEAMETGETEGANSINELSSEQQPLDEATEELFLQKLMSDESNEDVAVGELQAVADEQDTDIEPSMPEMMETTLKIVATPVPQTSDEDLVETQQQDAIAVTTVSEQDTTPEAAETTPVLEETRTANAAQTNLDMLMPVEEVGQMESLHLNGTEQAAQADDEAANEAAHLTAIPPEHVVSSVEPAQQAEQSQEEHFEDTVLPEPLPPKKGVWRTLIATLFHI